jgi:hypothetical protein
MEKMEIRRIQVERGKFLEQNFENLTLYVKQRENRENIQRVPKKGILEMQNK